jgi:uncharacterized protein with PQ loop repeat
MLNKTNEDINMNNLLMLTMSMMIWVLYVIISILCLATDLPLVWLMMTVIVLLHSRHYI